MLATRRNLMAAVAVLPLSACPAPAPASVAGSDPEWDRLCAVYEAARRDMQDSMAAFNERERAWVSGGFSEPMPVEPPLVDNAASITVEELVAAVKSPRWIAQHEAHKANVAAWSARRRAAERVAIGDAEDAMVKADGVATLAFVAVRDYRAPTLAALAIKTEYMAERYGDDYEASEAHALIADIRHLAGKEA